MSKGKSIGKLKNIDSTTRRIIAKIESGEFEFDTIEHMIHSIVVDREKVIQRLKDKNRPREFVMSERRIAGALRETIHAHGIINKDLIGSAAKRIMGQCTVLAETACNG